MEKKKRNKRILKSVACIIIAILAVFVLCLSASAATVNPPLELGDRRLRAGVPNAYITLSYGTKNINIPVSELFNTFVTDPLGENIEDMAYSYVDSLTNTIIYFNFSLLEANDQRYFGIRFRNLPNADYYDYEDLELSYIASDYTYCVDNGSYIRLEPAIYSSFADTITFDIEGYYYGLGLNNANEFDFTVNSYTQSIDYQQTIQMGNFNPIDQYIQGVSYSYNDHNYRLYYCDSFVCSTSFSTEETGSLLFRIPLLTTNPMDTGLLFDYTSYSGSAFFCFVDGPILVEKPIEVVSSLGTFFEGFEDIFAIEIFRGVSIGAIASWFLVVSLTLAFMRLFAGG